MQIPKIMFQAFHDKMMGQHVVDQPTKAPLSTTFKVMPQFKTIEKKLDFFIACYPTIIHLQKSYPGLP